jgi:hypothetical protein
MGVSAAKKVQEALLFVNKKKQKNFDVFWPWALSLLAPT